MIKEQKIANIEIEAQQRLLECLRLSSAKAEPCHPKIATGIGYELAVKIVENSAADNKEKVTWLIKVIIKPSAQPRQLRLAISEAQSAEQTAQRQCLRDFSKHYDTDNQYTIFIASYLSPEAAQICRDKGLGYLDFAGNCHITFGGIHIHIEGKPNQHKEQRALKNLYATKTTRILRLLLQGPLHAHKVKDLASAAQVSIGLVSKVRNHLLDQELAVDTAEGLLVSKPDKILDDWCAADSLNERTETRDYTLLETDHELIANQLSSHLDKEHIPHAYTQWYAAYLRVPYTTPPVTSCYVESLPDEASLLKSLGARPASPGTGRLRLIRSNDYTGITIGQQSINNRILVSDIQIYLDLNGAGLRADEQAQELRDSNHFNGGWNA